MPFFTIGHSNRSVETFVELLQQADIERVLDVRKFPMSRTNPQFNQNGLSQTLANVQIDYEHVVALGGRRASAQGVANDVNGFWQNKSFHNYADYTLSAEFHAGLAHLQAQGHTQRCAIMCSEAVWWRCHRRLIADHLIARGEEVVHIMGPDRLEPARLTEGAVVRADASVVYPAA